MMPTHAAAVAADSPFTPLKPQSLTAHAHGLAEGDMVIASLEASLEAFDYGFPELPAGASEETRREHSVRKAIYDMQKAASVDVTLGPIKSYTIWRVTNGQFNKIGTYGTADDKVALPADAANRRRKPKTRRVNGRTIEEAREGMVDVKAHPFRRVCDIGATFAERQERARRSIDALAHADAPDVTSTLWEGFAELIKSSLASSKANHRVPVVNLSP